MRPMDSVHRLPVASGKKSTHLAVGRIFSARLRTYYKLFIQFLVFNSS